jgi:mono/diheme cytochrome c family protein
MKKNLITSVLVSGLFIFLASSIVGFTTIQKDPWPVPDKYVKMTNPIKANSESISGGKELWAQHCQSCHGKKGLGDGSKAATLKTEPGDFSEADMQKQTDGSLFYKISEGRKDMPSFKKKIPDEDDIWNLVNLVRTFKK